MFCNTNEKNEWESSHEFQNETTSIKHEINEMVEDFRDDTQNDIKDLFTQCVCFNMSKRPFFKEVIRN